MTVGSPDRIIASPRRTFGLVLLSAVVLGVVGGVVWGMLAPAEQLFVVSPDRGAALTGESVHRFDSLALFVCVSGVLGVLLPVAWWTRTAERGVVMFAGLFVGSIACAGAAAGIGVVIAGLRFPLPSDPVVGQVISMAPEIGSPLVFLVQPLITSLIVVLLAALNPNDNLQYPADDDEIELVAEPPSFDSRTSNSEV